MFNLDNLIVLGYLVFVLWLGIYKGRNIKNMREFSVADRKYSILVMVATLSATVIGGGCTFGLISSVFSFGIVYILISFGNPVNHFLLGQFLVDRIESFSDCISVGDIMNKLYGRNARIITGICGALYGAAAVGGQVSAISFIAHYFLGVPIWLGILVGCGAVILYSSFGGVKAVTATDLLQFAILIIAIPMICNVGLNIVGGYQALIDKVPSHLFRLPDTTSSITNYFFIFLAFSIPFLDPPHIQRLLMAKDVSQIKSTLRISAAIETPFFIVIGLLGLIAIAINPDYEANLAFPHLVNTILPSGLRGFAIAGLLSVVMSTADSYLNTSAISMVHDTIKPLMNVELTDKTELRLAKLVTFILGVLATVIAISFSSVMSIILFTLNFWGPIIVVPLYAGLLGFKPSARCFYAGSISGVVVFFIWYFFLESHLGIEGLIPSMAANALAFYVFYNWEKVKKPQVAYL
jgi:SSS family solute:Na+ symporter